MTIPDEAKFCKYHPTRLATRVVGHGHGSVCEACWTLLACGKDPATAARTEPQVEETKEEEEPMAMPVEKCWCGRDKGHTGRHIRKGQTEKPMTEDSPRAPQERPGRLGSKGSKRIKLLEAISELKREWDEMDQAIGVLEGLL